jgi:hypothetical protein
MATSRGLAVRASAGYQLGPISQRVSPPILEEHL